MKPKASAARTASEVTLSPLFLKLMAGLCAVLCVGALIQVGAEIRYLVGAERFEGEVVQVRPMSAKYNSGESISVVRFRVDGRDHFTYGFHSTKQVKRSGPKPRVGDRTSVVYNRSISRSPEGGMDWGGIFMVTTLALSAGLMGVGLWRHAAERGRARG